MIGRRWTRGGIGLALAASSLLVGANESASSDTADISAPAESAGLVPAVRGVVTQIRPIDERPCAPGELLTGVDVGQRKIMSFSFDDGPWPTLTRSAMSKFEARGLRTTFFVIGIQVREFPQLAKEIVDRGFTIANHTITHSFKPSTIAAEIGPNNDLIERVTGVRPILFRSPGLTQGNVIQSTLADAGMCNIFSTADLRDYVMPRRSSATLCASFAATLHPGYIALLHDGGGSHENTIGAIDCMLDVAIQRGYTIVDLPELLRSGRHYFGARQISQNGVDHDAEIIGE